MRETHDHEAPGEESSSAWTCVFRGRTVLEAEAVAASLRAGGFEAMVDQPNVGLLWGPIPAVAPGGVAVLVATPQAEEARAIILNCEHARRRAPEPSDADAELPYEPPMVPALERVGRVFRSLASATGEPDDMGPEEPARPADTEPRTERRGRAQVEPAGRPPSPRSVPRLWAVSILGAVFCYPFLSVIAMIYGGVLADRFRAASRRASTASPAEPSASARQAWWIVAFNAALLVLGAAVFATAHDALQTGLVPFGPFIAVLLPYARGAGLPG